MESCEELKRTRRESNEFKIRNWREKEKEKQRGKQKEVKEKRKRKGVENRKRMKIEGEKKEKKKRTSREGKVVKNKNTHKKRKCSKIIFSNHLDTGYIEIKNEDHNFKDNF